VKLFGRNSLSLVFGVVFIRDKIGGLLIYLGVALYGKKEEEILKKMLDSFNFKKVNSNFGIFLEEAMAIQGIKPRTGPCLNILPSHDSLSHPLKFSSTHFTRRKESLLACEYFPIITCMLCSNVNSQPDVELYRAQTQ
jgi:hypothetical protein